MDENFTGKEIQVRIYDIFGRIVLNKLIYNKEESFDLSHLSKGIYLVKVQTFKGHEMKKLVLE